MNIAFILPKISRKPMGGFKVIFEYANYMSQIGINVTIYFLTDQIFRNKIKNEIIRHKAGAFFAPLYPRWFKLDKRVKRKGVFDSSEIEEHDIIIATAIRTAFWVNKLENKIGKKVYFIQGFENWKYSNEEVYYSYELFDEKIVVSKWLENIVNAHSKQKAILLSNAVNTDVFNVKVPIEQRKKHSIAFHYREGWYKGGEYAIEAIRLLKNIYDDLTVYVVGTGRRPENLPDYCIYKKQIKQEEVARINNLCEVFLCSSIEEGFGLPGLEAMCCGCVLVTSDFMGAREYAVDGYNALLSPVRNFKAMAESVKRIFEDEELKKQIIKGGIETSQRFSFQENGKKLVEILSEINSEK